MGRKIKIIIVDDHAIFRGGLESLLSQTPDFIVQNEAKTGKEFLDILKSYKPDIVLMDISMPEMDGVEATEKALEIYPDLKIIALSSYSDNVYYYKMIKAGVQGFVLKKSSVEELERAINEVYSGRNYFPQDILKNIILKFEKTGIDSIKNDIISLSQREKEILQLICQGFKSNEIAEKLYISPRTVDNHRNSLLFKTNSKNSAHLVMFAIKHHLVQI
jgi:DNA-binding NarL/FixJ family response regulator